jgi:putative isomerase
VKNGDLAELLQPDTALGAALESGMDNSPMYDDVPFDHASHLMMQSDVGLISLYVTDCQALAAIAGLLGQTAEQRELLLRAEEYSRGLAQLWNASAGIFQNRRTDTGGFNPRISPTCLYPLLAGVATADQGREMVERYLVPEQKFGGDWTLPSVPRDDPAFAEQNYWRGRVWAPLNFFVYLGLRRAGLAAPAKTLAAHSRELFERNWRERGGVFENFSAITGQGGEVTYSDPLCPWSGLLMLIALMEDGKVPLPSILGGAASPKTLPGKL